MVRSTKRVYELLSGVARGPLEIVSDDAPAYAIAARTMPALVHRRVYPNPARGPGSDRDAARERDEEMFVNDMVHRLWRHTEKHHGRETIAFGRRSNAVIERAFLFTIWRNFVKKVTERRSAAITPAIRLRLVPRPLEWQEVFSRRLFPERIRLPRGWKRIYCRDLTTPAVGRNVRHDLVHAF